MKVYVSQKGYGKSYFELLQKFRSLEQENKQLKEEIENDIDRYEDTISYQLGYDKGKEYMHQRIDKAIEWVHKHISKYNCKGITIIYWDNLSNPSDLLEILGDKE